ncbi:sensor histidine kinase [Fredinandcohnia sp. 179-A 10B2 NHS]|uniref:sensor histidine kinase n=1 Tax=Fredinandcohnia sp. 179-A 10B2 NHS TaxID=3235176 RepID=UPI0039A01525
MFAISDAKSLTILTISRVGMFVFLSIVYYLDSSLVWEKVLTVFLLTLLVSNHFLMHTEFGKKHVAVLFLFDMLFCSIFGFIFGAQDSLYLIFFGILAVTLFIIIDNKSILKRYIFLFFALWIAIMLVSYLRTGVVHFGSNIISFSFVVFGAIVGQLIRKLMDTKEIVEKQYRELEESHVALKEANLQLKTYSNQVEELTTIRERNRIAREIHDTVGHKMTALLIQIQLAQEIMKVNQEKSVQTLQNCDQLAREALQEVRLSVRAIHEDEGENRNLVEVVKKMLHDFSTMTSLETELELQGDLSHIPTSIQPAITRIIQESLTNSKKHGQATDCKVRIHSSIESIIVEISDNGMGSKQILPGFGLVNMRERVQEHGGQLKYFSEKDSGFTIRVEFPLIQLKWSSGV